ncbi:MBL fold metallo-hydrolase [Taklimakanibacter lacteus]|uniref:MBL fold metallo-hydrolase n=1 Tax=Taklimakanibacter lacteus TaxID=2268456 RepID=UPI000E66146E
MTPVFLKGPDRNTTRYGETPRFREGLYRLAGRTYAWMVPNGSWGEANFGLVDCRGKSVIIDTGWDLTYAREFLGFAADIVGPSPVDSVINTHADGDHCWGNQLFAGRRIIATHACIRHMHHVTPGSLRALAQATRVMKALPVAGLDRLGHYAGAMLAPYDFRGIRLTTPNQGFSGETTIAVNGVELTLIETGPAHTEGDAMVHVPSERVLYAGDILFTGGTPVMWAGPLANIIAALRRILALDAQVIVPGHGPVATRPDVELQIAYWQTLEDELHKRRRQGMPPARAAADLLLSPSFQATAFARWDSPERIIRNAHALYEEWGDPPSRLPVALTRLGTLREQASLAMRLPMATPRCMHRR